MFEFTDGQEYMALFLFSLSAIVVWVMYVSYGEFGSMQKRSININYTRVTLYNENESPMYIVDYKAGSQYISRAAAEEAGKRLVRVLNSDFWIRVATTTKPLIFKDSRNEIITKGMDPIDLLIYYKRLSLANDEIAEGSELRNPFFVDGVLRPICGYMKVMPVSLRSKVHCAILETFDELSEKDLKEGWNV